MKYMLDTNILIYFLKNQPASVADRIDQLDVHDELVMSFITYAELLKGVTGSLKKHQSSLQLESLCKIVKVLYPDNALICQYYATHFLHLKKAGKIIGGNDLWICCHALAENAILVTHNTREFSRIEGLPLEDWVN